LGPRKKQEFNAWPSTDQDKVTNAVSEVIRKNAEWPAADGGLLLGDPAWLAAKSEPGKDPWQATWALGAAAEVLRKIFPLPRNHQRYVSFQINHASAEIDVKKAWESDDVWKAFERRLYTREPTDSAVGDSAVGDSAKPSSGPFGPRPTTVTPPSNPFSTGWDSLSPSSSVHDPFLTQRKRDAFLTDGYNPSGPRGWDDDEDVEYGQHGYRRGD
jgi:hypothetical protein